MFILLLYSFFSSPPPPFFFSFLHAAIVQESQHLEQTSTQLVRNKFHWQDAPPAQQLLLCLCFKGHYWKLHAYQIYLPDTSFTKYHSSTISVNGQILKGCLELVYYWNTMAQVMSSKLQSFCLVLIMFQFHYFAHIK